MQNLETVYGLWGKTRTDGSGYPLVFHMMDTAGVASAWLRSDKSLLELFTRGIGLHFSHSLIDVFSVCAAFHDLGKATLLFQNKKPELAKSNGTYNKNFIGASYFDHGFYGSEWFSRNRIDFTRNEQINGRLQEICIGAAWHHGSIYTETGGLKYEGLKLEEVRKNLIQEILEFFKADEWNFSINAEFNPAVSRLFAGFVSVCDWISSSPLIFPDLEMAESLYEQYSNTIKKAKRVIEELGLLFQETEDKKSFQKLFSFTLRKVQEEVESFKDYVTQPFLMVIEAPTGEGKTEAAFYIQSILKRTRGVYFALPTKATANQMYFRVSDFIRQKMGFAEAPIVLAHGTSWLSETYQHIKATGAGWDAAAEEWFYTRKRTLISPVGVGTIDQALLSVMNIRHGFVKLFGLSGKTIIIDEVHAYDSYMMPIISRLIEWGRYAGMNFILLSATLPQKMKKALIDPYTSSDDAAELGDGYPLVTYCGPRGMIQKSVDETRKEETIFIELMPDGPDRGESIEKLKNLAHQGGHFLWICNTVKRAQEMFLQVRELYPDDQVILFHSRYTLKDRKDIEDKISSYYGKKGDIREKCKRSFCIATQVIEQSLDVDFDTVISEIAPIDLLLQRFGRMHRHEGRARVSALKNPRAVIIVPEGYLKGPEKKGKKWKDSSLMEYAEVYDSFSIYRTIDALSKIGEIKLPGQYRNLVEYVYGDTPPELNEINLNINERILRITESGWKKALECVLDEEKILKNEARQTFSFAPDVKYEYWGDTGPSLVEDEKAEHFVAKTRYGDNPSLDVVIIKDSAASFFDIGGHQVEKELTIEPANIFLSRILLEKSINISSPAGFIYELKDFTYNDELKYRFENEVRKFPALKHARCLFLDTDDRTELGNYSVIYSKESGLSIEKISKEV